MDVCLERLSEEMESAIAGMSLPQMERAPEGKWSTANILEHLAMAFGGTAKALEERLARGEGPQLPAANLKQRAAVFAITTVGFFPGGVQAPAFVVPTGTSPEISLRRFRENLGRMDSALDEAGRLWGRRKIAVHPILGPMTAWEWRRFHYIHTRHHVKQVRALKNFSSNENRVRVA